MALFSNTPIGNVNDLSEALAGGSHFELNNGKLETLGFFSGLKRSFLNKIWYSNKTIMERDKGIMEAMTALVCPPPDSPYKLTTRLSGPVFLALLSQEERDVIIPHDKLAEVKNFIATTYIEEKLTVKTLMARHQFSRDDATLVRECLLNNIDSGFLRPMLANCKRMDAIPKCLDALVAAAKNKKGAFLLGLDPNNSFPKIWKDIKNTKLCEMHNLAMDSLLGKVVQDFENWTTIGEGKTADKSAMALWLENSCPTLGLASVVYPRNHGYSAYKGSFEDKMRLGSLLQNDPSALAFALEGLDCGKIRKCQPEGELTLENIWKGVFGAEKIPQEAQEGDFSSKFSERVDKWFKDVRYGYFSSHTNTANERALIKRMVKEFKPVTVASVVGGPNSVIWNCGTHIDNAHMINPKATLPLVPYTGEAPIQSILRNLAQCPPVMKPNQHGILEPHIPVLSIETKKKTFVGKNKFIESEMSPDIETFPVGDPGRWGAPSSFKDGKLMKTTFPKGPKDGGAAMVFSDDDIRDYKKGLNSSKYSQSIINAVKNVCLDHPRQFDTVMRLLSNDNDAINQMIGNEGLLHGLPGVSLIKPSGFDMKISRESDGSIKVNMTSGQQPFNRAGWRMSVNFFVDYDGSSKRIPEYDLSPVSAGLGRQEPI